LSLPIIDDPVLLKKVEALAREIVGGATDHELHQLAGRVAEQPVRQARHQLFFDAFSDPNWDTESNQQAKFKAVARCARTAGPLTPMPDDVMEFVFSKPNGAGKFATLLSDRLHELFVLDRYERRTLSKRKSATRAFDQAKIWLQTPGGLEHLSARRRSRSTTTAPSISPTIDVGQQRLSASNSQYRPNTL
jgi:hypothetical protein